MPSLLVQPIWEVSGSSIAIIEYEANPEDRRIVYVNPAFVKLTGFSYEETLGKPVGILDGPGTDQSTAQACETALRKGTPFTQSAKHYRKDGSEYLCRLTVSPLLEPDGRAAFLISVETETTRDGYGADQWHYGSALIPLTLPMPLREFPTGPAPTHLTSHPELKALRDLWGRMSSNGQLPRRSKFDLDVMKRWASHISIATVLPDNRFQFRLFGTDLTRVYGRDLTDFCLDELSPGDLWSVVILHYQAVVKTRQPLFAPISISNGRWYSEVSRLLLPLSSDDSPVAFIMGADYSRTAI